MRVCGGGDGFREKVAESFDGKEVWGREVEVHNEDCDRFNLRECVNTGNWWEEGVGDGGEEGGDDMGVLVAADFEREGGAAEVVFDPLNGGGGFDGDVWICGEFCGECAAEGFHAGFEVVDAGAAHLFHRFPVVVFELSVERNIPVGLYFAPRGDATQEGAMNCFVSPQLWEEGLYAETVDVSGVDSVYNGGSDVLCEVGAEAPA